MLKTWFFKLLFFRTLFVLFWIVFSFLSPISYAGETVTAKSSQESTPFSGADFWREIRDGQKGNTAAMGIDEGQLINVNGQRWREIRNHWVSPIGLAVLLSSAGGIFLFYLWAGKIALVNQRTGKKVLRWTPFERAMHWFTAIIFILLALSGIILLYGKHFIMPMISETFWGSIILGAKLAHNYLGPLFVLGLVSMLFKWFKNNILNNVDMEWFKQGGGMLKNGCHPDAGFCNGGEKIWYWIIATVGIVVCVTGLIMDFPIFGQTRGVMQVANILHGISSLGLLAVAFGHIYIGTVGTEGVFEGMATGYVDESWAKQHHKLWYETLEEENTPTSSIQPTSIQTTDNQDVSNQDVSNKDLSNQAPSDQHQSDQDIPNQDLPNKEP